MSDRARRVARSIPSRNGHLDATHLRRAAWASTTRRVDGSLLGLLDEPRVPTPGDLVLARVDVIGFHSTLQLPDGRRRRLFVGDEIVVAYGNRYAPNQFEAVVPKTMGPCQLAASGGIAAKVLSFHGGLTKTATDITPLAMLATPEGRPANLRDHALPAVDQLPERRPIAIAVVGTSMDSGKTQTAAFLVKGLTLAGMRVGFAKMTGTGSGGDTWLLRDAGADPVLDFTDAGLATTYRASHDEVVRSFVTLHAHLCAAQVDAIVLEIADGVLQRETAGLLNTGVFREAVGGLLFTACDAMGAMAGQRWLRSGGLPLIGLSGVLTSSPLALREASKVTGLPLYGRADLARASNARRILAAAERRRVTEAMASRGRSNGHAAAASRPRTSLEAVPLAGVPA
ncbi:MAG TPA: DUF1611 domain-containing protein [Candidatus Eisenbacteria bacterium]|nr:DUF1611 domain-containing protein [Candidatus Eisenbacteria bacterium]